MTKLHVLLLCGSDASTSFMAANIRKEPKRILLVCGGGASSGFLAANMRKDAKKKNFPLEISAKSETVIDAMKDEIDILLIGPHLRFKEQEIRDKVEGSAVSVAVIDETTYSTLDGEKANKFALSLNQGEGS